MKESARNAWLMKASYSLMMTMTATFCSLLSLKQLMASPSNTLIFAIQKLLKCAVGDVKSVKKLHNGAVLIEVISEAQADKALRMSTWFNVHVKASPHRSLSMSKGIIRCRDLWDCSHEEILDALRHEGVTKVKHILSNKNGMKQPAHFCKTISSKRQLTRESPSKCSFQTLCSALTATDLVTGETVAIDQLSVPSAVNRATQM
jgi:hypothetical protein